MANTQQKIEYNAIAAEDNQANLMVLKKLLTKTKLNTEFVKNGKQVVNLYTAEPEKWSMVFMDCEMPIIDGYTATKIIREYELKQSIPQCPIIGLSAHSLPEFQKKAITLGMNDYIIKPINRDLFYATVQNYIK